LACELEFDSRLFFPDMDGRGARHEQRRRRGQKKNILEIVFIGSKISHLPLQIRIPTAIR